MPQLTTEAQVFIVEKLIETKSLYLSQCPPPPPSCRGGGGRGVGLKNVQCWQKGGFALFQFFEGESEFFQGGPEDFLKVIFNGWLNIT